MEDEEKELGWVTRLHDQLQRRWFEIGNDSAWVLVGFMGCFVFAGALAPINLYFPVAFFAYDVVLAVTRACIELNRLYQLRKQYTEMAQQEDDPQNLQQIEEHLAALRSQIIFETIRLGSHVTTTSIIFLSMCCALPLFAINPVIPVAGAICLVLVCLVNFALARIIEHLQPKDMIEKNVLEKEMVEEKEPFCGITKIGFFAKKQYLLNWKLRCWMWRL